jgi:hypothetical protein
MILNPGDNPGFFIVYNFLLKSNSLARGFILEEPALFVKD